jgi:hypothetical protein
MSKDLKDTLDDSSSSLEATTSDVEGQVLPDNQENAADSSPAADEKETVSEKDWDPLAVVKKAVGEKQEDSEGADEGQRKQPDKSSKSENDGQKAENADEDLGEITDEELKSYKPKTRKRIEGLLDDRQRLTERLTSIEPAAEQFETLQTFMQERKLTPANVSELMVVGGLAMSDDPKDLRAALTRAEAFTAQIKTQLGEILPEDLKKKVDEGLIDADTAKEVALTRVEKQRADVKVSEAESTVKTVQQTSEQTTEATRKASVHSAINDWTNQKMSSDPDYPRKAELLQKEIKLRVHAEGGKVLDTNKAVKIANEAYAEVNRLFKALSPSGGTQAKRVLQSKAVPGNLATKPNTPLDAARAGLAKSAG